VHPGWEAYDLNWWYAAPVSGLGFNDNAIDISYAPGGRDGEPAVLSFTPDFGDVTLENRTRTVPANVEETIDFFREPGTMRVWGEGTVQVGGRTRTEYFALPDPDLYAARALRVALASRGVSVAGATRSTTDSTIYRAARHGPALAEVSSRPFRDWIFPILNTSQNWFAEMVLKQLGKVFGQAGSWDEGIKVERRFLIDSVGIDSTQFALSDGSGLAASNLVSPLAFTQLLRYIRAHPRWSTFAAGLPQSGNTGSLRTRFKGTPLEGKVRAKTGSISRVNTLSGYVELERGRGLVFSVQANHHTQPTRAILAQIDSVVVDMARGR
jgi:D-alanyl-D-alanine carboxypeptidase/D-alanyl-D-alanine-endopeptidase (penicillin-binding protein 4)